MKKIAQLATLALLAFMPAIVVAAEYEAPTVKITDPGTDVDLVAILNTTIGWILGLVGGIAVLFLIWGGLQYVTSAGNKDKADMAKKTITYAVVGLIIIVLAEVIVSLATDLPSIFK